MGNGGDGVSEDSQMDQNWGWQWKIMSVSACKSSLTKKAVYPWT